MNIKDSITHLPAYSHICVAAVFAGRHSDYEYVGLRWQKQRQTGSCFGDFCSNWAAQSARSLVSPFPNRVQLRLLVSSHLIRSRFLHLAHNNVSSGYYPFIFQSPVVHVNYLCSPNSKRFILLTHWTDRIHFDLKKEKHWNTSVNNLGLWLLAQASSGISCREKPSGVLF